MTKQFKLVKMGKDFKLEYTRKDFIVRYKATGIVKGKTKGRKYDVDLKIRDKYIGEDKRNKKLLNGKNEVTKELWRIEYKKDHKGNMIKDKKGKNIIDWKNKNTKRMNFKYKRYTFLKKPLTEKEQMEFARNYVKRMKWEVKGFKMYEGKPTYMSAS